MRLGHQIRIAARDVRLQLGPAHRQHGLSVPDLKLYTLCNRCQGSPGLAADAMMMYPRPGWVEGILGPYPAGLELANPEDVASVAEWGSADLG